MWRLKGEEFSFHFVHISLMTRDPALYNLSLKTLLCFLSTSVFSAIQKKCAKWSSILLRFRLSISWTKIIDDGTENKLFFCDFLYNECGKKDWNILVCYGNVSPLKIESRWKKVEPQQIHQGMERHHFLLDNSSETRALTKNWYILKLDRSRFLFPISIQQKLQQNTS